MTKPWISLLPCALSVFILALSCGSSDNDGPSGSAGAGTTHGGTGGNSGFGGTAGTAPKGGSGGESGSTDSPSTGGTAGADDGSGGEGGGQGGDTGAGGDAGGAGGSGGAPEDVSPLSPSAIPDLAFWMDGKNGQGFSDIDENYPTPLDSGRVRSMAEAAPLTGHWQAPSALERPIREPGALRLMPVESVTGYYLKHTGGAIQTDDFTVAISLRPLNSNSAQGSLAARVGTSPSTVGIFFAANLVGLYVNHTQVYLKKRISRASHATMIVRFTPTRVDVQYDINGFRSSESVDLSIAHETASNWQLGYDGNLNADIYGFVSQVVGVNRAVSDTETGRLMTWLSAQPIPEAFPVTQPLVAISGDSIANGDQIPGWQSWPFRMLGNFQSTNPDVQLLNTAANGAGIPKVKNSDYSDFVLPWYSASRAKNILIVAAGTNDLIGTNVSDVLDRYYGLLDSARATGWKTVACTVLPRSDTGLPAAFETGRTAFNADVVAHYASHADALANVAAITGMGAAGDSDNLTYYTADKVHPRAAGHALMEPVYRAAVTSLLSAAP